MNNKAFVDAAVAAGKSFGQNSSRGTVAAVIASATLVLGGGALVTNLKQFESQELKVYADKLARGLPTYCSGVTDWKMPIGKTFT